MSTQLAHAALPDIQYNNYDLYHSFALFLNSHQQHAVLMRWIFVCVCVCVSDILNSYTSEHTKTHY